MRATIACLIMVLSACNGKAGETDELGPACMSLMELCHEAAEEDNADAIVCHDLAHEGDEAVCEAEHEGCHEACEAMTTMTM